MIAKAVKRYERISPRKVKRMLDIIRGKGVVEARALLKFNHSRSRIPVLKTLDSAVANLKVKVGSVRVDDSDLYIKEAKADEGPMMKRWRAGFRGTADMIRRRTCHITLIVDSYKPLESEEK
ncbi:MAG TPA: 50S ribosomal protein L22 [candidate division WOR-3 bacterium]|uniref:Large ribosomal subunit protein uL22 n=1 Tax=candidate division WOR-3 bacterium TaxID=2052148 RepID=A0A9C9EKM8_UNCW3|nr:50S ribosomal protein L22 [candidate division WOR-3 bacterium]